MRAQPPVLRWLAAALAVTSVAVGCQAPRTAAPVATPASVPTEAQRQALAPTGALRIAAYAGSPTSLVRRPGSDDVSGMSIDIGREMARRLGVPARIVEFDRVEQVVDALRSGDADMTITNATAARAALVDFTPPVVSLELGYLVMADSAVASMAEVDRAGVRVGVSRGSSSQATLSRTYREATLVPASSLKAAAEMLKEHRIDAFATNKGVLFQLADGLPGARVLDGRWGVESLAIAVPKGRESAKPWLEAFVLSLRQEGLVQKAAERAGLRGTAQPERP
jgi:polar amino acid transport system substrate-binding protein